MEPEAKVKKKKRNTGIIIIGTIFVAIIIILLIFLMQGKTTTSGNYPENVSDESLTCTATNIDYPFFTYDNAHKKTAEVNILFSDNKLKSITLIYNLYYNDATSINASEAHNHAAMGQSFADDGFEADAMDAVYSKFDDRLQMRLYVLGSQFKTNAMKYFMINSKEVVMNIEELKNIYQKNGFACKFQ